MTQTHQLAHSIYTTWHKPTNQSPPTKDDLQQWVRHQADKFCQKYLSEETEQTSPTVLDILSNAVNRESIS